MLQAKVAFGVDQHRIGGLLAVNAPPLRQWCSLEQTQSMECALGQHGGQGTRGVKKLPRIRCTEARSVNQGRIAKGCEQESMLRQASATSRASARGGSMQRSGWMNWTQQQAKSVIFWCRRGSEAWRWPRAKWSGRLGPGVEQVICLGSGSERLWLRSGGHSG